MTIYFIYECDNRKSKDSIVFKKAETNKKNITEAFETAASAFAEYNPNNWHLVLAKYETNGNHVELDIDMVSELTEIASIQNNQIQWHI